MHCHTNYSFKEGASEGWDLLVRAHSFGIHALAITDHDNLCGAMEFAQSAKAVGIKAIIGAEATLSTPSAGGMGRHHVTLLARNATGYSNLCQLLTKAHMEPVERNQPALDPAHFAQHAEGLICLSGCRQGQLSELLLAGEYEAARSIAGQYAEWFGEDNYFLELQQNLVRGDTARNRLLARLGRDLGIGLAATNNVHYHIRERHRLNDALTAIQHNKSLEETHSERRPNDQFYIKPPAEMTALFSDYPAAISNTTAIAERCEFDLATGIKKVYSFPDYETPEGHTAASWLRSICQQTARHKYDPADKEIWNSLQDRLEKELSLIERYKLSGFLLQYRDIVEIAHEIQIELGIVDPHTRLDDQPPGRGRGSSVALVVGYLIGLSHIDPLKFGLGLERFMPDARDGEEIPLPDIDLDFPREIREELILRVHNRKGPEFAVLTGMISTYRVRGAIRDLGKALGLPQEDLAKLIKKMDGHAGIQNLANEMAELPEYRDRIDAPLWKDLLDLAGQLNHFPKVPCATPRRHDPQRTATLPLGAPPAQRHRRTVHMPVGKEQRGRRRFRQDRFPGPWRALTNDRGAPVDTPPQGGGDRPVAYRLHRHERLRRHMGSRHDRRLSDRVRRTDADGHTPQTAKPGRDGLGGGRRPPRRGRQQRRIHAHPPAPGSRAG